MTGEGKRRHFKKKKEEFSISGVLRKRKIFGKAVFFGNIRKNVLRSCMKNRYGMKAVNWRSRSKKNCFKLISPIWCLYPFSIIDLPGCIRVNTEQLLGIDDETHRTLWTGVLDTPVSLNPHIWNLLILESLGGVAVRDLYYFYFWKMERLSEAGVVVSTDGGEKICKPYADLIWKYYSHKTGGINLLYPNQTKSQSQRE